MENIKKQDFLRAQEFNEFTNENLDSAQRAVALALRWRHHQRTPEACRAACRSRQSGSVARADGKGVILEVRSSVPDGGSGARRAVLC